MEKITKETLIPVGLVISIIGIAFNAGKISFRLESVQTRVEAIELDRSKKIDGYTTFQNEVLQRLTRIEEAVKTKKKGD